MENEYENKSKEAMSRRRFLAKALDLGSLAVGIGCATGMVASASLGVQNSFRSANYDFKMRNMAEETGGRKINRNTYEIDKSNMSPSQIEEYDQLAKGYQNAESKSSKYWLLAIAEGIGTALIFSTRKIVRDEIEVSEDRRGNRINLWP